MRASEFSRLTYATLAKFGDPWTSLGPYPFVSAYYTLTEPRRDEVMRLIMREIHRQVHLDGANPDPHGQDCDAPCFAPIYGTIDTFVHAADLNLINEDELPQRLTAILGESALQP